MQPERLRVLNYTSLTGKSSKLAFFKKAKVRKIAATVAILKTELEDSENITYCLFLR